MPLPQPEDALPRISNFFGISIYIYWREHPPAHFHARYGGEEALFGIEDLAVLEGKLSPRAHGLIIEWATLHQDELRAVWTQAEAYQPLSRIPPLE